MREERDLLKVEEETLREKLRILEKENSELYSDLMKTKDEWRKL